MSGQVVEHHLPNGLHVICEVMPRVRSAALGFLVSTGSRHERPDEHGVSHFLEHMCFKGTAKRNWRDITVRFDELGSVYNAFTGKEHTMYFGWVPAARAGEQLELLADMIHPSIPADEYETERKVILEEIAMSGDSFDHHVWNFLHETVFGQHPLAHEILGERESVERMPRDLMVDYHRRRYAPGNLALVAVGAVEPEAVFAEAGRWCGDWHPQPNGDRKPAAPSGMPGGVFKRRLEQFKQQAVVVLYPSVPHGHEDSESLEAFCSLFGGLNSRCYWNIVQKGICSQAGAAWLSYGDYGMLALYADGEPERCDDMLTALKAEAAKVAADGFSAEEVQRVKNRRRTQLALESENPKNRLMQVVDDLENYQRVRSPEARLAAVEAVTARTIADHLHRYPITGDGLLLSAGPADWPAGTS